jgi:hypothetical protein
VLPVAFISLLQIPLPWSGICTAKNVGDFWRIFSIPVHEYLLTLLTLSLRFLNFEMSVGMTVSEKFNDSSELAEIVTNVVSVVPGH